MNAHHRDLNLGNGHENGTGEAEKRCGKKMNDSCRGNGTVGRPSHDSRPVTMTGESLMEETAVVVARWEGFFFCNCRVSHQNLTSLRIAEDTGRHIRDGDMILEDNFHNLTLTIGKRYLHKFRHIFLPNSGSDRIRTVTVSVRLAIKGDEVDEADRGQRGSD